MYTEIFVTGSINKDNPAVPILLAMFDPDSPALLSITDLPKHEFFSKQRAPFIGNSGSFYLTPFPTSSMGRSNHGSQEYQRDPVGDDYYFVSRSDLKNYHGEINAFFNWLRTTGAEFFGYSRYEDPGDIITQYHSFGNGT